MFYHTLRTALHALRRNKMRAALTTLGIIIGIAAVIAMVEIGGGSAAAIQRSIAAMGANTLIVLPGSATSSGVSFGVGTNLTLTPQDAEAIARECPSVEAATPVVRAHAQVVYGNRNWVPMQIEGTTQDFVSVRNWPIGEGEIFTDRDVRNSSKVCVIGQTLVRELFQGEPAIGKEIRVRNVSFRVIGILKSKGANMMGFDQDDILIAPWTSIKYRVAATQVSTVNQSSASNSSSSVSSLSNIYPGGQPSLYPLPSAAQLANTPMPVRFNYVDQIIAAARSPEDSAITISEITNLLRERHRIPEDAPDDFTIRAMAEISSMLTSTTMLMSTLLLSVALISLVVGGVGIMNIMLVSVTERTREIGLRMAVGARPGDILRQFVIEAVVLCLIGGVTGIALGRGCATVITFFLNWPTQVSIPAIAAAVIVSMGVGIVFGFYPAWKASRLDPIEALRYE